MSVQKIAHVCLAPVEGPSRIETYYGNEKIIRIYLTIRPSVGQVQNFKQSILQDFISVVQGYAVVNFEANNMISQDTIRLFLSVCQNNNRVNRQVPVTNNPTPLNPQISHAASLVNIPVLPDNKESKSMQDVLHRVAHLSSNPNELTQETINNLITDMSRIMTSTQSQQVLRNIDNPQPQPTSFNVSQSNITTPSQSINPLMTLMQQLSTQNPFMAIQQFARSIPSESTNDDSEPPPRFIVNERNPREVLIHQNPQTDAILDVPPSNNTTIRPAPSHTAVSNNTQRSGISDESITTVAKYVHHNISTTAIRPPDFTNNTRSGYRKIKNFIHNLTKIWLSQHEIDKFLIELKKIDAETTSNNENEVGLE